MKLAVVELNHSGMHLGLPEASQQHDHEQCTCTCKTTLMNLISVLTLKSEVLRPVHNMTSQGNARIGFKSILALRQASTRGRRIATRRLASYCED